jgi:hypothetical protein
MSVSKINFSYKNNNLITKNKDNIVVNKNNKLIHEHLITDNKQKLLSDKYTILINNYNKKNLIDINSNNNFFNSKNTLSLNFINNDRLSEKYIKSNYNMNHYDINMIYSKGIKILNNVYQSKYNNNSINSTGLGDFIRGCYFILEICDKYNFKPKFIFNNHISIFLKIKTYKLQNIQNILTSVKYFKNNNIKNFNIEKYVIFDPIKDEQNTMSDFIEYIINLPVYNSNVFIACNSFPNNNNINEKNKEYMRRTLEPINEIKNICNILLQELNLKFKQFCVIHVRSGDSYLKNEKNEFNEKYINKLINNIKFDISLYYSNNSVSNECLVISDNNLVKILLKKKNPKLNIILNDITHFGEGVTLEEENVKNSLVDFYLLSFSNAIFSYSCYQHGSGFSYWCAKTYNIPYICKFVDPL